MIDNQAALPQLAGTGNGHRLVNETSADVVDLEVGDRTAGEDELEDGRQFTLKPGMSYQVADHGEAHRSQTERGAKLFIVD